MFLARSLTPARKTPSPSRPLPRDFRLSSSLVPCYFDFAAEFEARYPADHEYSILNIEFLASSALRKKAEAHLQ